MNDQKPFIALTPLSSAVKNYLVHEQTGNHACFKFKSEYCSYFIRNSCLFLVNKCSYLHDFLRALIIWSNVGHSCERMLITVENIFHVFTAWIDNWQFQCQSFTFWQNHLTRCQEHQKTYQSWYHQCLSLLIREVITLQRRWYQPTFSTHLNLALIDICLR